MTEALQPKVVKSLFSEREEGALQAHLKSGEPPLSPTVAAQFFELFLHGHTCTEIQKRNKSFKLGAIVRSASEQDWHAKRDDYMKGLFEGAKDRASMAHQESQEFVQNLLAAANKMYGQKLLRYLQTGNEDELKGCPLFITSLRGYKDTLEMFMKLTGMVDLKGKSNANQLPPAAGGEPPPPGDKTTMMPRGPFTEEQAAAILLALEMKKKL